MSMHTALATSLPSALLSIVGLIATAPIAASLPLPVAPPASPSTDGWTRSHNIQIATNTEDVPGSNPAFSHVLIKDGGYDDGFDAGAMYGQPTSTLRVMAPAPTPSADYKICLLPDADGGLATHTCHTWPDFPAGERQVGFLITLKDTGELLVLTTGHTASAAFGTYAAGDTIEVAIAGANFVVTKTPPGYHVGSRATESMLTVPLPDRYMTTYYAYMFMEKVGSSIQVEVTARPPPSSLPLNIVEDSAGVRMICPPSFIKDDSKAGICRREMPTSWDYSNPPDKCESWDAEGYCNPLNYWLPDGRHWPNRQHCYFRPSIWSPLFPEEPVEDSGCARFAYGDGFSVWQTNGLPAPPPPPPPLPPPSSPPPLPLNIVEDSAGVSMICPPSFVKDSKAGVCQLRQDSRPADQCASWDKFKRCDPRSYVLPDGQRWPNNQWGIPKAGEPMDQGGRTVIYRSGLWVTNGLPLNDPMREP